MSPKDMLGKPGHSKTYDSEIVCNMCRHYIHNHRSSNNGIGCNGPGAISVTGKHRWCSCLLTQAQVEAQISSITIRDIMPHSYWRKQAGIPDWFPSDEEVVHTAFRTPGYKLADILKLFAEAWNKYNKSQQDLLSKKLFRIDNAGAFGKYIVRPDGTTLARIKPLDCAYINTEEILAELNRQVNIQEDARFNDAYQFNIDLDGCDSIEDLVKRLRKEIELLHKEKELKESSLQAIHERQGRDNTAIRSIIEKVKNLEKQVHDLKSSQGLLLCKCGSPGFVHEINDPEYTTDTWEVCCDSDECERDVCGTSKIEVVNGWNAGLTIPARLLEDNKKSKTIDPKDALLIEQAVSLAETEYNTWSLSGKDDRNLSQIVRDVTRNAIKFYNGKSKNR